MIFFIENGRLGNQIFQINYLKKKRNKNEICILFGFNNYKKLFRKINNFYLIGNHNFVVKLIIKYRYYIEKILIILKLFNYQIEDNKNKIISRKGIIKSVNYISGFYQGEFFFDKKKIKKDINRYYLQRSKKFIKTVNKKKIFFIHFRSSDFKIWPSRKFAAILPIKWYIKCIKEIKKKHKNVFFIILSDDVNLTKNKFNFLKEKIISTDNQYVDFCTMVLLGDGICSASSFSWWSSYYSNKIYNKNKKLFLYAPEYWAGHSKEEFFPKYIKSNFFKYIKV